MSEIKLYCTHGKNTLIYNVTIIIIPLFMAFNLVDSVTAASHHISFLSRDYSIPPLKVSRNERDK